MSKTHPPKNSNSAFKLRKLLLSGFVVSTFAAYSLHERAVSPDSLSSVLTSTKSASETQLIVNSPNIPPTVAPTVVNIPPTKAKPLGRYKDGEYTGGSADAYYGLVQVKAIIQNSKIVDVKFLDYPNHRRTSQYINSIAMPDLTYEAIQAQNANVNIISGATLTSEAFIQSLQSALNAARNV